MAKRDNFNLTTKRIMAERVAWRCSFPNCGKITIGPRMGENENDKSLNLGEAAHIVAAAEDGPRYDSNTTQEYRKSIDNGIWMCRAHARFIDTDYKEFSVETLRLWKLEAEEKAYRALSLQDNYKFSSKSTLIALGFEVVFEGTWEAVDKNEWTFKVEQFIEGNSSKLKEYADNYGSIDCNQKFISVVSQGDARVIQQPINIQYLNDGSELISVRIAPKVIASLPENSGMDFMLGDDGDIVIEGGDIKMVTGVDNAIQNISTAASMQYGEWFADRTAGSFITHYYNKYKSNVALLNQLIKLEFIRLSLVPRTTSEGKLVKPPLNFIKEVKTANLKAIELKNSSTVVTLSLVLGNGDEWNGDQTVYIGK